MKLHFHSTDPEGLRLRQRALERVRGGLRRLRSVVRRVRVRLEDINGPLAGVDKRCHVQAVLPDGRVARVEARSRDWGEAVDLATSRLRERVVRHLPLTA